MVPAILLGTVLLHVLTLLGFLASRHAHTRLRRAGPRRPVLGAEELTPLELGMLAGGLQRLGEVALAELYLGGRVIARGHGAVARPDPEPSAAARLIRTLSPPARVMADRLRPKRSMCAEELVNTAARSDQATVVLWRLRRLGLFFPPQRMRGVRRVRCAAVGLHTVLGVAAAVLGPGLLVFGMRPSSGPEGIWSVLCAGLLLTYPFHLHLSRRAVGALSGPVLCGAVAAGTALAAVPSPRVAPVALALYAGWFTVHGAYRTTGGRLGPRTLAGDALLAEAHRAAPAGGPTAALRSTALLGFRSLRRQAGEADPPELRELALVRSFAAAVGRGFGRPDGGLGGDFSGDGGSGIWRGDGDPTTAARNRPR